MLIRCIAFFVLVLGANMPSISNAQTFECTERVAGQRACQAGVNCECRYFRASAMTELPAGYRWDCGISKARCVQDVPATSHELIPRPLPHAVAIDRSSTIDQDLGDNATIGVGVGIGDGIQGDAGN